MIFVAIDFETADYGRDSACAVGLVRVEAGRIVTRKYELIRPPREEFVFTYIHGITWNHVAEASPFSEVWRGILPLLEGADFLVAHNKGFDRGVVRACCAEAGLEEPLHPWLCTVQMARHTLGIRPANLAHVCQTLDIPLRHHEALSDAEACASIVLRAARTEKGADLFSKFSKNESAPLLTRSPPTAP